tara:strand:- start:885 stop:1331 length:447 start_codon:yes stop_codon:yes gene_type:complete
MDEFITRADTIVEEIGGNPFGRFEISIQLRDTTGEVVQNAVVPIEGTTYSETMFDNLKAVAKGELHVESSDENYGESVDRESRESRRIVPKVGDLAISRIDVGGVKKGDFGKVELPLWKKGKCRVEFPMRSETITMSNKDLTFTGERY